MYKILTIAGSDPSGGAGIQADIKTITMLGAYAMSAITAVTIQNTTGVFGIHTVPPSFMAAQLDAIFQDIPPDAIKIGMLSNQKNINIVSEKLKLYSPTNVVIDPVLFSTSGSELLDKMSNQNLITQLFPLATLITPNIPEAEQLSGKAILTKDDMQRVAYQLYEQFKVSILLKGGHLSKVADDLLITKNGFHWFNSTRIQTRNTHGTGCTLSSAIACHLASGNDLVQAIHKSKLYVRNTMRSSLDLGKGNGPLHHNYAINASL